MNRQSIYTYNMALNDIYSTFCSLLYCVFYKHYYLSICLQMKTEYTFKNNCERLRL